MALHYTVDGSLPSRESPRYVEPFFLTDSRTVRARAIRDDKRNGGPVTTHRFERLSVTAPPPD